MTSSCSPWREEEEEAEMHEQFVCYSQYRYRAAWGGYEGKESQQGDAAVPGAERPFELESVA